MSLILDKVISGITHLCANFQMLTKLLQIIHASILLGWEVVCSSPLLLFPSLRWVLWLLVLGY